ncbi:MAG: rRNA pseudouridine synthase [Candidatus Shikimatogenerans sp. JK-2022]|nr:rRNA pseudouridine synthase [Candidatus Shikimatogenerans bostrichidophilus]
MKNFNIKKKIRLNKYIAYSGICSRRKADNLIKLGFIFVNGKKIQKLGFKVLYTDKIKYNNNILKIKNEKIYILINKPKNCITSLKDNFKRKTVMSYIPPKIYKKFRIYPVGRLDKNTTGLLLLTNDGFLCNKLLHPKNKIIKKYKVILNKNINIETLIKLKNGIILKEGKIKINNFFIKKKEKNIIFLSINLGWNRIIHRIFKKLGYKILYLQRIYFGGLKLNKYIKKEGKFIVLSKKFIYNIIKKKNEKNFNNKWT